MKKLLFTLLLFTPFLGSSQEMRIKTVPSHPVREITTYTPQQEYELAASIPKDLVAPTSISSLADGNNPALSAEASSSLRFKDVPVNLATGAMSLPVPLYTLSEGLLSVPISMSFNGSGMKNQEVASWCGAGWNLNAGGMITRMVRGLPDEGAKYNGAERRGYFKFGFGGDGTAVENDTEPDIFYLNINGATHKMIYRYDGENSKFEFFPDADITVVPTFEFLSGSTTIGRFVKFEVILPDGVHYIFGNGAIETTLEAEAGFIQSSGNYPGTSGFTNLWKDNAQSSVWYLKQIVSPYGQEINFEYDAVRYSYYRIADHGVDLAQTPKSVCPEPSDVDKEINRVFVQTASLAKISGVNTRIEFNQRNKVCFVDVDPSTGFGKIICYYEDVSNPRIDIDQWERYPQNESNAKRLNEMLVMENTDTPQDTLTFSFDYGHFFGVTNDLPSGYSEFNSAHTLVGYTHQRRLRLEQIDFPDQTNVRFRYKGDSPSYNGKSRLDYGIDHWGYANGYTGNRTLTGLIPKDSDYPNCISPTSNRESNSSFGFYGSMDSVVYSNRKTIAFEYETHTAKNYTDTSGNYKQIGGARIKQITSKDLISGIETKKEYDYNLNGATTGHLALKPTYRYKTPFNEIGTSSSIYDRLLAEMGRPPVVYNRVSERLLNTSDEALGTTVYYFDNDTTELSTYYEYYPCDTCDLVTWIRPEIVHPVHLDNDWDHKYKTGNLIKTETFNEAGDTLGIKTWDYTTQPIWTERLTSAAKVFRVNGKNIGAYYTGSGYNFTQEYGVWFAKYRLESQTSKAYSQIGSNPLVSIVNYVYKDEMPSTYKEKYPGKHNQLVKTETTDSRGQLIENYIKYPADFNFIDTTIYISQTCYDTLGPYECGYSEYISEVPQSGSQARGIFEYYDAGLWTFPLETNAKIDEKSTGASYTTLEAFDKPTLGFNYAPKKSFSAGNIGDSFFDLTYDKLQNDTINREPSYFEIARTEAYNDYGLTQEVKGYGGARSKIIYDASKLLTSSQIGNLGGVFVDSVQAEYDKRLFGTSKTIGVNKLENKTIYDTTFKMGLVKQVLDKDNYLLAEFDYLEPNEAVAAYGISSDSSKFRTLKRMPRVATSSLPNNLDSLDIDLGYYDADGRLLQSKLVNASPSHKDLIGATPNYDSYGRPFKSILPVSGTGNDGGFESGILSTAQSFYGDDSPFSEVSEFEASPLSRVFKSLSPGDAFRPGKELQQSYETGDFGILKRNIDLNGLYTTGAYTGHQLVQQIGMDEEGNKTIQFADKEGRILESHVQFKGDGSTTDDFIKTTYLYDFLGRQAAIIPPLLYDSIPSGTNLLSSSYIDYVYYSKYDSRGRVVETHVPDAGWSYKVYNRLGQMVMSQNERQRTSDLWEWVKYDARGNLALSGIVTNSTYSRENLQNQFDDNAEEQQYEERFTDSGNVEGYTNRSYPAALTTLMNTLGTVMTVNYFDDYDWLTPEDSLAFKEYKTPRWPNSKGLGTGTKVKRLDTNEWLSSAFYYDDKNRVIQTQNQNRYGQVNQTDRVLDFIGQLLEERTIYHSPLESKALSISTNYSYDHAGRVLDAVHNLNSNPEVLASYEYDDIGRLAVKHLNEIRIDSIIRANETLSTGKQDFAKHYVLLQPGTLIDSSTVYVADIASGLQRVNYNYDVQGNLVGINCDSLGNLDSSKVFALKLDYFQDGRYYNGLLSKQTWMADSLAKSYVYDYDKANRFKAADYQSDSLDNYDVNGIYYDANGNIETLNRFGQTDTTAWGRIDSLVYTYSNLSNRLSAIDDYENDSLGFGNVAGANEYTYYPDGSLKSDGNKGITDILYNYMGLPDEILLGATQKIKNVYTADGQKLIQYLIDGSDTTKTEYVGDLIYVNNALTNIWHAEGIILVIQDTLVRNWSDTLGNNFSDTSVVRAYTYQYFIEDHLGNNRVVFQKLNDSVFVAQRADYYPFGGVLEGVGQEGDWNFLYQGNEFIDAFGYDNYDFNLRQYDPFIGRFTSIDPVDFASQGGYNAMFNNPLTYTDPNGDCPNCITGLIGAAIGGIVNLGVKAYQGQINDWGDGFAAFGIGAAAGFVTGFTGGAAAGAFGLSSTGVASGIVTGAVGSAVGDPIRGLGNAAYFQDPYTLGDYGTGILMGGVIGGAAGGVAAKMSGTNWWNGAPNGSGVGTFGSPKFNNEAIAKEGWVKGAKGSWINNAAPEGYGGLGNGTSQFPDWIDDLGQSHKGGTYPISNSAAQAQGKLSLYPNVLDLRTGSRIPLPNTFGVAPQAQRAAWNSNTRASFIKEWYDKGYPSPKGGWGEYDIHHILPREFGGGNNFWNLTPVLRKVHVQEFNEFWRNFGMR